jgi:hypothetical protein
MITVNDLLQIFCLANVETIKINDIVYDRAFIKDLFGNAQVKRVIINTSTEALDESQIACDLYCDKDFEDLTSYISYKLGLPNSPSYIKITLNFII